VAIAAVAAVLLVTLGVAAAQPVAPLPASKASLAVLPLASPGRDARQERLADGIAEDLIAELGRYRNIAVIAKSSSFTSKGKPVDGARSGASSACAMCSRATSRPTPSGCGLRCN
jgi:TolB-like protein